MANRADPFPFTIRGARFAFQTAPLSVLPFTQQRFPMVFACICPKCDATTIIEKAALPQQVECRKCGEFFSPGPDTEDPPKAKSTPAAAAPGNDFGFDSDPEPKPKKKSPNKSRSDDDAYRHP